MSDPLANWGDRGENAEYMIVCDECLVEFIGHKRRVRCPRCTERENSRLQARVEALEDALRETLPYAVNYQDGPQWDSARKLLEDK